MIVECNPLIDGDYLDHFFRILDGKINFDNLGKKKRGRKKGYKHSQKTKDKIADRMRDRSKSRETKDKISKSLKGREKSPEVREKISRSKKETNISDELINDYIKPVRLEDKQWLQGRPEKEIQEAQQWIIEHYDEYLRIAEHDVRTTKDLKGDAEWKEKVELLDYYRDPYDRS